MSAHTDEQIDDQSAEIPSAEASGADDAAPDEEEMTGGSSPLTVTESALTQILELRAAEDDSDDLGLRVEITGATGNDFTYDLSFAALSEAEEDDSVTRQNDLTVIIPADTIVDLRGATLDLPAESDHGGLVLRNPNKPNPLVGPAVELEGTVEERVRQLLDGSINPALADHGGFAALERVDEPQAFVTMGGGCQGCAVSAMTLRDGIQAAIVDNIDEIDEVVDVTDHDAGDNPFY